MPDEPFPLILTRDQVRFEIMFGMHQIARATIRDWAGVKSNPMKAIQARDAAIEILLARFDWLQVRGPAPMESIFADRVKP